MWTKAYYDSIEIIINLSMPHEATKNIDMKFERA